MRLSNLVRASYLLAAIWMLLTASIAQAGVYAVSCLNCNTTASFVAAAVSRAQIEGQPGTFVVMSQNYDRSAAVKVTGTPTTRLREGMREAWLANAVGSPIDLDGAAVTNDAQLDAIDMKLFGDLRGAPKGPITYVPGAGGIQSSLEH